MTEDKKPEGRKPDFKGDGVAVWVNEKDGKKSLGIKLAGHDYVYAYENKEEEKPKSETKPSSL